MRRAALPVWMLLFLLVAASFSASPKRVLILNSYNPGYLWSDLEMQGIDSVLKTRPEVETHLEYMDAKYLEDSLQLENLQRLYAYKYGRVRFDAILAADNNAFNFLRRFRDGLFPGTPVVFCGINDFNDSLLAGHPDMTGVAENADYAATIALVPRLWPRARTLVIVNDSSLTGLAHEGQLRAVEARVGPGLRFRPLPFSAMTLDELRDTLQTLPDSCAVLYLSSFKSRDRNYSFQESMRRIVEASPVPVFAVNDSRVLLGATGGFVVSGFYQGAAAAGMALRILDGTPVSNIPVMQKGPNRYMFDHNALERYGIPERGLPRGSIVLNAPLPIHEKYRAIITALLVAILLILVGIGVYHYNLQKRHLAETRLRDGERRFHEALAEEKERLQITLHSIAEGVIVTDENNRIILMNFVAEALTGWQEGEALGWLLSEVYQTLRKGDIPGIQGIRTTLVGRRGEARLIADNTAPIRTAEGRTFGQVLAFRDITEQVRLEEGLLKAERLESLGLLAGGIAHDFNNLLGGIFGYMELARQAASNGECEKCVTLLGKGFSVYGRACGLTRQLLTFTKGGAPVRQVMALSPLIRDGVQFVMSGMRHECALEVPDALWPCEVDESQILQVIDNLVINAQQAMPEGGCITVRARNLPAHGPLPVSLPAGAYVKLTIADTGSGIPPEQISRIFDPFFTTKKKGTGLGLTVVQTIVKKHGGGVEVESELQKGTVVHVYLPAHPDCA
ncbi:MAG: ABC transporter substrate binding protein [Fibrobacterota bacterium]